MSKISRIILCPYLSTAWDMYPPITFFFSNGTDARQQILFLRFLFTCDHGKKLICLSVIPAKSRQLYVNYGIAGTAPTVLNTVHAV